MDENQSAANHRVAKRVGAALGLATVGAMTALTLGHDGLTATSTTLAGSGDAPANTTFTQPVVAGMNMGGTATWAPPATTLETPRAAPLIRAGG
jgi:hypothetical protein